MLRGLDQLISKETGMPVQVAENPLDCVAAGTGKLLENLNSMKEQMCIRDRHINRHFSAPFGSQSVKSSNRSGAEGGLR